MQQFLLIIFVELKLLLREKLFLVVSIVFLGLTMAAAFIGWSTSNTVNHAYALSLPFLAQGVQLPPNPYSHVSHLSLQRNLGIYLFLIGSLLAIIIGYGASLRDRTTGLAPLIMTRSLSKRHYIFAKASAVGIMLAVLMLSSYSASLLVSALLPELHLSAPQMVKLGLFYGLSWVYLLCFGLIGLIGGLLAKNQMLALLIPVTIWIVIGFVIPQAISGLEPTALLNPVTVAPSQQLPSFFTHLQAIIGPFSFAENYKVASGVLLEFSSSNIDLGILISSVFGATTLTIVATWWLAHYYHPNEEVSS